MINLIPPHGNTALKHEYLLRVSSVYCFILAGIFAASAALMIPTYVLTSSQLNAVESDSSEMEKTKTAFNDAAREIKTANAVMSILHIPEEPYLYSTIVEEIVRQSPRGITFTTFQGAHQDGVLTQVIVQGVATNRNVLAAFKEGLEASPLFETATVPIADLARDTNLPFVVTLTMATPVTTP